MRFLILSENIGEIQAFGKKKFSPPNDVQFIVGNLNDDNRNPPTVIDYDVAVVHIHPSQHSMGYFSNLPKVAEDTSSVVSGRRAQTLLPLNSAAHHNPLNRPAGMFRMR